MSYRIVEQASAPPAEPHIELVGLYGPSIEEDQERRKKAEGGMFARLRAYFLGASTDSQEAPIAVEQCAPPPYEAVSPKMAHIRLEKSDLKDRILLKGFDFSNMEQLAAYMNAGHPPFNSLQLKAEDGQIYTVEAMFNPERPNRLALYKKPLFAAPGVEATPITKSESALWREQVASCFVDLAHVQQKQTQYSGFSYCSTAPAPSAPPAEELTCAETSPTQAPMLRCYKGPVPSAPPPAYDEAWPAYNPAAGKPETKKLAMR